MQLWLLLTGAFIVQEPISSSVILLEAYKNNYNVWLITLLFSVITILEIIGGYYLGIWIEKKFGTKRLVASAKKHLEELSAFIGEYGKIVGLIVFVPLLFPIASIFVPWLEVSLGEAIVFIFIGELIFWYAYEWLLVFGIHSFFTNSQWALASVLIVSAIVSIGIRLMIRKSKKKKD